MLVLFLLIVVETIMPIPVERETQETSTYTYVSDIADLDTIRKAKNKLVVSNLVEKKELNTEDQTKTLVSKMERCHLIKVICLQVNFMQQFGYLPQGTANSEALHTEDAVVKAVKEMQKFGGLQPTGVVDTQTLEVNQTSNS